MKVTITAYKRRKQRMDFVLPEGETIIGRSSECDLCVNDSRVSRKHCKLIVSGETAKVVDLTSLRGTYVNGRRIAEAELTDGGRLSIGRIYFKIDIDPTADATPAVASSGQGTADSGAPVSEVPAEAAAKGKEPPNAGSYRPRKQPRKKPAEPVSAGAAGNASGNLQGSVGTIVRRRVVASELSTAGPPPDDLLGPVGPVATLETPAPGQQHSIRRVLRHKWTILLVSLLVAGPGIAAIWTLVTPQYQASGQIRVRPIIPHLVFRTEDSGAIPFYQSYLNTQVGLILNPTVLQRVLDQADVQATSWYKQAPPFWQRGNPSKLERLQEVLDVRPRGRTEFIDVSVKTKSGEESAVIVNAVLDRYMEYVDPRSDEVSVDLSDKLDKKYRELKSELEERERYLASVRKQLGTSDPVELVSRKRVRLDEMQAQLSTLRRTLEIARWRLEQIEGGRKVEGASSTQPSTQPAERSVPDPRYRDDLEWRRLHMDVETARHAREVEGQHLGEAHPAKIALQKRVEFAERIVKAREAELEEQWRLGVTSPLGGSGSGISQELAETSVQIRLTAKEKELLERDLQAEKADWERIFDKAEDLNKELAAIRQKKELYNVVRIRREQKQMERNVPGSIKIAARAVAPSSPSRDRRMILTAGVLCLALGAGVGLAFLRAGANPPICQADELSHTGAVPFLGQLPRVEGKGDGALLENPQLNEGIRMVRTPLLQRIDERGGNVVLITSAGPGDGKTTVAVMLARSLAHCGKKVLLVDADLRNPSVCRQLGIDSKVGLVDVLSKKADENQVIVETDTERLSVLPAGHAGDHINFELVANGAFSVAVSRWRDEYDVVLLDSPPVLPVADARILARHADGTILVVWAERTRRTDAADALSYLNSAGGELWGTVLIGSPPSRYYRKRYNYSYGEYR